MKKSSTGQEIYSSLKDIAFKTIMVLPSLLLQKPSKKSKAKDHWAVLTLWHDGNILELSKEGATTEGTLKSVNTRNTIGEISKNFIKKTKHGNINGAIKLLTNNMQNGVFSLNEKTLELLRQKHPKASPATEGVLLTDDIQKIHPIKFENLTEESVKKAALKTKGGSGPSAMDAEGWRRILTSKQFGNSTSNLCKAIVRMTRKLCTVEDEHESLEAFVARRLVPLDKNPGLRPIGIGEIVRRIAGKVVVSTIREDITESVVWVQVCAGQETGSEAAVHAMNEIFEEQDTEAVLLLDATNAFNRVNRKVLIHNAKVICPAISTYVNNCYRLPSRLFVIDGTKVTSEEGTTQGGPTAMAMYAIAITPIIMLLEPAEKFPYKQTKIVAFTDDLSASGSLSNIKKWQKALYNLGPEFGCNPEVS